MAIGRFVPARKTSVLLRAARKQEISGSSHSSCKHRALTWVDTLALTSANTSAPRRHASASIEERRGRAVAVVLQSLGRASRRSRAKRTRRPRRTARSRSGPARAPWTDPGRDTEIPREANGLPSWRRRGAVVLRLSPPSGADENQAPGVEAVEAAPGPRRHGRAAEALSFAQHNHASGSRQPPFTRQPEQGARS